MTAEEHETHGTAEEELERILGEYGTWLESAVRRFVPGHLGIDAVEVQQLVTLRLWKALRSEKVIEHPPSYLRRVISSVTVDAIRTLKRRKESSLDMELSQTASDSRKVVGADFDRALKSTDPGPQRLAESGVARREVREAMAKLSDSRRRAVSLQLQGFTTPQAARMLGWSEAKTRNLIWRGIQDLRRYLERAGISSEGNES